MKSVVPSCAVVLLVVALAAFWLGSDSAQPPAILQHRAPPGFVVELVAGEPDVVFPMFACFDERGRLFVAESSGLDLYAELQALTRKCRIRLLEDPDPTTGRFRRSSVFVEQLVFPMGLVWRDGKLYVADPPDLVTFEDTDGDGRADRRTVVLTGFGHKDNGSLHGLTFGPDGRLYLTMGAPDGYRLARPAAEPLVGQSGALIRCRADGSEPEVLCRGFVNLVEVAFTPQGDVVGTDNWYQKPAGGVRDALVHCVAGGLYPYEADVGTPLPVTGELLPAAALFPAAALSGVARYEGAVFPLALRSNLFVAQHNTRKVSRHVLIPAGATFRTEDYDFVTSDDPDFRPSDLLEAPDGSLLVVDTGSWYVHHCPTGNVRKSQARGGIYRVRPTDWTPPADPLGLRIAWGVTEPELAKLLGETRPAVRHRAGQALSRRGKAAVPALESVLKGDASVPVKQQALWALARIEDESALTPLRAVLIGRDPELLIPAARAAGLRRDRLAAPALVRLLTGELPATRLAAAEALARCGRVEDVSALLRALREPADRFLEHALVHALHHLAEEPTLLQALDDAHPRIRKAALLLLNQPPRSKDALKAETVLRCAADPDAALRQAALGILAQRPAWAPQAAVLLRGWLVRPNLGEQERQQVRGLILALQGQRAVQELVAEQLRTVGDVPAERQVFMLETLALTSLPALPKVWTDALEAALGQKDTAVRREAVRTAAVLQAVGLGDRLARLADDTTAPADVRLDALRAVVMRRPSISEAAFVLLREQFGPTADPLARLASAELLGRSNLSAAQLKQTLAAVRGEPLVSPGVLLPMLGRCVTAETGPEILDYLAESLRGGWRPPDASLETFVNALPKELQGRGATLRDLRRQQDERQRARLAEFEPLLQGGDPERGRQVFLGKKAACVNCHRVGREGGLIGPDLTKVGAVRTGGDILESIVFPSSTIAQGYEAYAVATSEGRTLGGVLVRQSADTVVLRDSGGADILLRRDRVEWLQQQPISLMPEGLERALSREEMRDLLAYLQALK